MDKRLVYPQYNQKGNRDVFSVTEDRRWLQKTSSAYHPEIQKYIEQAKPIPNLIQVLLTALGAHEYWGQNVNGDRFYEDALKHKGPDYGHQTFLTNANYFTHHVNKDPALSKGKVLGAVWNEKAHRVELIVGIDQTLDPDAATALDNGESLCFSMGARLPFDVCTVCGNKARTRAEYCDHLRYQMNQIDPVSGLLVGAINPTPKFFDISRVMIPADKTAYMWEKIASAGAHPLSKMGSAQLAEIPVKDWNNVKFFDQKSFQKTASVQKSAEIRKQIPAIAHPVAVEKLKSALTQVKHALDADAEEIPKEVFSGGPNLSQCLSCLAVLGIAPTAREKQTLVDLFAGKDGNLPHVEAGAAHLNSALLQRLAPYAEGRSFFRPPLLRRIIAVVPLEKQSSVVDAAIAPAKAGMAITTGVLTALGAIFGVTGSLAPKAKTMVDQMPTGLAGMIAQHPVLAGILGALVLRSMSSAPRPVTSGNFTVADPSRGFYNNDWQRRFYEMQNRPVSVIKTGAVLQSETLVSPLTYLLMTVDLEKTAEMQRSWEMIADQVISFVQSPDTKELVKSAARIAGVECLSELASVAPEIGDIDIIKHALELTAKK